MKTEPCAYEEECQHPACNCGSLIEPFKKNIIDNLNIGERLTFKELIKHGIENGANVVNGTPWSWKINGYSVTHENDGCYIIETIDGFKKFRDGDVLALYKKGLHIFPYYVYDTHAPGSCQM